MTTASPAPLMTADTLKSICAGRRPYWVNVYADARPSFPWGSRESAIGAVHPARGLLYRIRVTPK